MNKSAFEEILALDGRLVYTNVGDSMLPLIRQGRDLLVIKPKAGRLKKAKVRGTGLGVNTGRKTAD